MLVLILLYGHFHQGFMPPFSPQLLFQGAIPTSMHATEGSPLHATVRAAAKASSSRLPSQSQTTVVTRGSVSHTSSVNTGTGMLEAEGSTSIVEAVPENGNLNNAFMETMQLLINAGKTSLYVV
jgi:hypothetical protein